MSVLHVVFDTNIYRKLRPKEAAALSAVERGQSVEALAGYYPALELGARLSDKTHSDFNVIRAAFAAMWQHTHHYNGYRYVVPMLNDWDSQLAWGLFRVFLQAHRQRADEFGYALGVVGSSVTHDIPDLLAPLFADIAEEVREREAKFTSDMKRAVRAMDPQSIAWQPHPEDPDARHDILTQLRDPSFLRLLARSRVSAAAEIAGVRLTGEEEDTAATGVLRGFPTAINFLQDLLIGMVEVGIDFSKRQHANSAWDMALAATISPSSSVKGVPTLLVTDDRRFHTAAIRAGHQAFCLRFDAYRDLAHGYKLWEYAEALPRAR